MRILLISNSPHTPSAYGRQTKLFLENVKGHDIAVASLYGTGGAAMEYNGHIIYPAGGGQSGDGNVGAAAAHFRPDILVSFYDAWPLTFKQDPSLVDIPWVSWTTVDSAPLDPRSNRALGDADEIVAYSRFGQRVLDAAGYEDAGYIPCGFDDTLFRPGNKNEARKLLGLPDGFLVGMVGRNNTAPSRKGFDVALLAFKAFLHTNPDAYLFLHTNMDYKERGLDLFAAVEQLGLQGRVLYPDQAKYRLGLFSDKQLVSLMQSLDVLIQPSMNEGFGVPLVEAMACGTPVIATDHSAMSEIARGGRGLLLRSQLVFSAAGSWVAVPGGQDLLSKLQYIYNEQEQRPARYLARGREGHKFARENYSFQSVVAPAWEQFLKEIQVGI